MGVWECWNNATPGGRALRFYSTIRLEVRKGEQIINNSEVVGHKIKIKVVKKIVIKAAVWYTYDDVKLGQGKEKVNENLETNPTLL